MVEIRNTGRFPALVQGYWLYPGETRSVPAKAAARLLDANPALVLYSRVQTPAQPQVEVVESAPDAEAVPEVEPEPTARAESVADEPVADQPVPGVRRRRK